MDKLKRFRKYFLLLVLGLSSCGINSVENYLNSFEEFVEDFESCETITSETITSIKKEYLDYTETYYSKFEPKLTDMDKERISRLKIRYYKVLAKYEMKDIDNALNDIKEKTNEFINQILE